MLLDQILTTDEATTRIDVRNLASPRELDFAFEKMRFVLPIPMLGVEFFAPSFGRKPTRDELTREFRNDPTSGRDPETRLNYQAEDGVTAEVVFPKSLLTLGATPDPELNLALAQAYNEYMHETFSAYGDRIVAVPLELVKVIS